MSTHNFQIVNVDTDSISFRKPNGGPLSKEDRLLLLNEINSILPEKITFEDDGYFKTVLVLKAKNYVLFDGKEKTIKGSALRGSAREKALKEFIGKFSDLLLEEKYYELIVLYHEYIREIINVVDITRWSSKKTITDKVLNPERTNEQRVLDSIKDTEYTQGDKIYVFFDNSGELCLQENWVGNHDRSKLLEKLWKTVNIFNSVIDIRFFPKYHLKKYYKNLDNLI